MKTALRMRRRARQGRGYPRFAGGTLGALAAILLGAGGGWASSDQFFNQQWGLSGATSSINAPQAWCASTGGVLVGDIDTGADFGHQDLAGRLVPGARFTSGNGNANSPDGVGQAAVQDDNGHGTMTTGLIVANKDNGIGIAGIASSSQALVVKVLDSSGSGNTNDVAAGIRWAAAHGARVINLSLGTSVKGVEIVPDQNVIQAIRDVSGTTAVAVAAGNNQVNVPVSQYAQIAQVALVAGALGPQGELAWYSTSGQGVNIYAPGGDDPGGSASTSINVISTYLGNRYAAGQGTSFAAPHVAGTLALLMSRGLSPQAARQRILDTAVSRNGLPELDAAAALGTSGGCASAPPAANDGGRGGAPGPPGTKKPGPATAAGQAPAGAAAGSASPSPSPSASASPSAPGPADQSPGPKALAHPPASPVGHGPPVPVILAGLVVVGGGAGFAAFRYLPGLR